MYSVQGKEKQKELVTHYNLRGQKTKQYWFWTVMNDFTMLKRLFIWKCKLTSLIDSFANGTLEKNKLHL
jgi:hypothetical protein